MFLRLFMLFISALCSFVLLRTSSLHAHIPQTISLSVGGHLRCFQLEANMNKAVCDYSCTRFCAGFPVLLKRVPQSEIPESHGKCPSKLMRNCQVLLQCAVSYCVGFSSGSVVKNPPASAEDVLQSLGQEDLLEEEMATHPVFLPGKFCGLRSLESYSPWGCKRGRTQLRDLTRKATTNHVTFLPALYEGFIH